MTLLQGISSLCGGVDPSGLTIVEYLPLPYIDTSTLDIFINDDQVFLGTIESQYNAGWLRAHLMTKPKEWSDQMRNDEQGPFYEREVEGVIPSHSAALAKELQAMKQFRYLVRVIDRSQQRWLLNTPEHGARFEHTFSTETRTHRIRFVTQVPFQAPVWNWN